jgi:glycosyltransferase involved in cell wall biosynthesis
VRSLSGIIVHEWISKTGGSERVLDAMVETFPEAEVWCLWNDVPESRYPARFVRESWLARTPLRRTKAVALPFMPMTWRTHRSASADWILASSHLFAHHVSLRGHNAGVKKFAYVHTPARYLWTPELDVRGAGWLPRLVSPSLRTLDRRRAQELYRVATNSEYVRARIQVAWEREAEVIYPPVKVARIQSVASWADELNEAERIVFDRLPCPFVLGASRFIEYKRLDLVIDAGESVSLPVVLAGSGPGERELRKRAAQARVPVYFIHNPSDAMLYALYEAAHVFVFPAVEDFGIMPVEAAATGTPVIVNVAGGASESVEHGVTGFSTDFGDPGELRRLMVESATLSASMIAQHSLRFDEERFKSKLRDWINVNTT